MDIGIYYGGKGVDTVKSLTLYQKVDSVVKFDNKFDLVKNHGNSLYTYLDGKIRPLVENVFFLYDAAHSQVTSYVQVVSDKH